ncbi:MAG: outer membrane protein assembly factor BamD [Crocinitomicaceae bacterium]|nr:outer membrane protein assembly factor BamD [Crocinitomicaceae bacterium]
MKNTILIALGSLVLAVTSCSDYNEVVKSDDYDKKIVTANDYFQRGSKPTIKHPGTKREKEKINSSVILRSINLYEQIYQRMPKTDEGELAYFRLGKAYYIAGDYYMGGYYLGQFPQRFPYSIKAEESLFLSAMCSVNNSPESSLDQTETELAINGLQQFVDRYPTSNFVDSCNGIMDGLRFKVELKEYTTVKLYAKTQRFAAAVSAANTFLEDYPMSEFKEEVYFILVKNSYLLAKNSIENKKVERINDTIERYNTFVSLFPSSDRVNDLMNYKRIMQSELSKIKSSSN